jgi:hypothetical protein
MGHTDLQLLPTLMKGIYLLKCGPLGVMQVRARCGQERLIEKRLVPELRR